VTEWHTAAELETEGEQTALVLHSTEEVCAASEVLRPTQLVGEFEQSVS
jgi:hypothetical protein